MSDVTKKLYRKTLGFIADNREPTELNYKRPRMSEFRSEEVKKWYDGYTDLRNRVDKLGEELRNSKANISVDHSLFYELIIGSNGDDNWISVAGRFQGAKLTSQEFKGLQQHEGFVQSFSEVVKHPTLENFVKLGREWRDAIGGNKRFRINRIFSACTYDVSTAVSVNLFYKIFALLQKHGLIADYHQTENYRGSPEAQWYYENIHIRDELRRIFKDELDKNKTDMALLWIFVWELGLLENELPRLITEA